ncbi:hypothetical protein [Bradyrhizobium sp.]|uniref:hypothetical protein n=1 Tax=Bradyrhizobium sp. TaxID=376 RepID=UPI0040382DA2
MEIVTWPGCLQISRHNLIWINAAGGKVPGTRNFVVKLLDAAASQCAIDAAIFLSVEAKLGTTFV